MNEGLEHIMEIEKVKKEADKLMMNKILKYETKLAELRKELEEVKNDNKKLSKQVEDSIDRMRKAGLI